MRSGHEITSRLAPKREEEGDIDSAVDRYMKTSHQDDYDEQVSSPDSDGGQFQIVMQAFILHQTLTNNKITPSLNCVTRQQVIFNLLLAQRKQPIYCTFLLP